MFNPRFRTVSEANKTASIAYRNEFTYMDPNQAQVVSYVEIGTNHSQDGCFKVVDNYVWQPVGCEWEFITPAAAAPIIKNRRKIVFVGDSHARVLTDAIILWLCGSAGPGACDGYTIQYTYNSMCAYLLELYIYQGYTVFFNCGQHPASGHHWGLHKYITSLNNTLKMAFNDGFNNKNLIWIQTTPYAMRNDTEFRRYNDWRTLARLQMYNNEADKLVKSVYNLSIVYAFEPMLPLVDGGCDTSHFTSLGALMPLFQQILHYLL